MLSDQERKRAVELLANAERERKLIPLLSDTFPAITIADAYRIQQSWIAAKVAAGARVVGHKIGLTSKVMQQGAGIDEPDYGVLLDDMVVADGTAVPFERFVKPRVEVELAFVLGKRLQGPNVTMLDVLAATEWILPALEIIDVRIVAPKKITDTISDNAASGAMVLSSRPFKPAEADIRWIGALLYRNAAIEESGVAAAVMGHPANAVAWLANRLAEHGSALEAGHVVLSGSFTRAIPVAKGDSFFADYGAHGTVSVHFS